MPSQRFVTETGFAHDGKDGTKDHGDDGNPFTKYDEGHMSARVNLNYCSTIDHL